MTRGSTAPSAPCTACPGDRRTAGCAGLPKRLAACWTRGSDRWNRPWNHSGSSVSPRRSGSGTCPPRCWRCGAGPAWSARSRLAATAWFTPCPRAALSSSWRSGFCWTDSRWPTRPEPHSGSRLRSESSGAWPAGGSIRNGRTASSSGPSLCSSWPRSPVCHPMSSTA